MIDMTVTPLKYNGHVVTTHKELQDKIHIDSFEDVIHGHIRKIRERENETNVPEIDRDPANKIDPKFFQLVQESRPVGQYFEQSMGDKLLFLKRIDGL